MIHRPGSPTQQVSEWLSRFGAALDRKDRAAAADLFADECYWRDLISFTWNIKTLEGKDEIQAMLAATIADVQPGDWQILGEATEEDGVTAGWFTFETAVARGKGYLRLKAGECWTLLTTMTELKGFEEKAGPTRVSGSEHGVFRNRKTWLERKTQEEAELGYATQPYCVIIGGGQGGIGLAARLKRLEVPTLIIEKNDRPGDSWRNRYKSLCLHDPVWYDHLPYLPFPDHWPVFSPKDKIGDWLEMYAKVMELNYWHSTDCRGAQYHEDTQDWTVTVDREGETVVLRPRQLVLATGMSGMPNVPQIPGADTFRGTQQHSSQFRGIDDYRGQEVRRPGLQQFGPRHLRRFVGAGRGRHHDSTLIDACREIRHAHGVGVGPPVLGVGRQGGHHDRHRRLAVRLHPVSDHARVPHPRLSRDRPERCRPLRASRAGGVPAGFRGRRLGAVHEVSATRIGLLHRCGGLGLDCRWQDQAPQRRHHRGDPARIPWC